MVDIHYQLSDLNYVSVPFHQRALSLLSDIGQGKEKENQNLL
jgi:hypothetical protein